MVVAPAAERARLGAAARARVVAHYSLDAVVARYEALWTSTAARHDRACSRAP
jgi:hypothetical protein